jgi:hypothetical protein
MTGAADMELAPRVTFPRDIATMLLAVNEM